MAHPPRRAQRTRGRSIKQKFRGGLRKTAGFTTTGALVLGFTIAGTAPAQAAPDDVSEGLGNFLGGEAVGIDLDNIANVSGAFAENPSGENPVTTNPLGAEVLNALQVDLGDSLQLLGPNGVLQLGAVNQYGEAQPNGDARAASGAVSDQGAISVGGSEEFPSNATLDLSELLSQASGGASEGLISDLSLELGALSSSAEQLGGGEVVTDYDVAAATLGLESPAIGNVYNNLQTTVDGVQGTLDGLSGSISDALDASIDLGIAGVETNVDFAPPDLTQTLPDSVVGESSGVTVDLTTGAVTVDLEALLAANPDLPNLNQMPANSELLSGPVVAAISDGTTQAITDAVTEVVQNLRGTVSATDLAVTTTIDASIAGSVTVTLNGTLGEILEGSNPDLVTVESAGAIGAILSALGLESVDELGTLVLNTVGALLGDSLTFLTDDLESTVDGITGSLATEVVGPVLDIVNQVVTVLVNVQSETGDLGEGSSTVRALQVSLIPATSLAQVNLASSTVRGTEASALDPSVSVTPGEALPGDDVDVDGTGYTPDSTVTVEVTDAEGDVVETIEDVPTDEEGSFSAEWTVPEGTDPGDLTVTATDDTDPEASDSDTLTVLDEDPAFDPSISAEPSEVEQGAETQITGSGFAPGETVAVSIPDAEPVTTEADDDGNISIALPVPADYESGVAVVTAEGDESETPATTEVTVTESDDDPEADADVDGTDETDAAADVDASASASASADADSEANAAAEAAAQEAADADANDAAEADASAASDVSADPAAQAAAEAASEEDASSEASSEADSSSETAAQASADSQADSAQDADSSAAAEADAEAAAEAAAETDASAAAAADADAAVGGDGEDADAVADGDGAEFDPSVTVEPDSVQPEDEVTVSGGDFAPGSSVSVVVTDGGGNEVGTVEGVEVGTEGNFTTAWTVPEGTDAGELTVTATDENITASATLTVTDGTAPAGATADADGDADEDQGLATTGSGTVLLIGGLSVLLLLLGLATLLIMRNRRMSTTE